MSLVALALVMCCQTRALGGSADAATGEPSPWDMEVLRGAPRVYPAPEFAGPGVRALFFEGEPYRGRPTRVFAWYGAPETTVGTPLPAMVLIHGGGGTAFAEWVTVWNERGYAAIALDTNGGIPRKTDDAWARHAFSGPAEWGGFSQIDEPLADQWAYHAVADVILANSLLRSFEEIDAERIGVTGISWGAYLTCIAVGVDSRFRIAIPVYGCGFLADNSAWLKRFDALGAERSDKWVALWDPARYLAKAGMPLLWVTGTNDPAYPLDSWRKSCRLPVGEQTLCVRVEMAHNHRQGLKPAEIYAFADRHLRDGPPPARITAQGREGARAWAVYAPHVPIIAAQLNFTGDTGAWRQRRWETIPATVESTPHTVWADLPDGVRVYYFNVTDRRGLVISSEYREIGAPKPVATEPQVITFEQR